MCFHWLNPEEVLFCLHVCKKPRGAPNMKGENRHQQQGAELKMKKRALGDGVWTTDFSSRVVLHITLCCYYFQLLLNLQQTLQLGVSCDVRKRRRACVHAWKKAFGEKIQQSRNISIRRENVTKSEAWSNRLAKDVTSNKQVGFIRTPGVS